ncbi:hypothetical protein CTAYLR_004791 [Chrysophaeum taylorii]|uniref:Dynein heavy chain C-terminal domain-containing protein n=1 Tax=Chrysophaeum taylorii TaxID=2483200 RepID=A0AAD7UNB7_9STRA|nr:hypothetical protein CTAYLR_004791 [Chrysophaeum taylorii]
MQPGLMSGLELAPGFKSPDPNQLDYNGYFGYVDSELPPETPPQFGLHPNAEIGYLTISTSNLFSTILSLGGGTGGGGGGSSEVVKNTMADLKERCPAELEMFTIGRKAEPLLAEPDKGPYIVCALQECRRMNVLTGEITRSLSELEKGLNGQLNMTQAMEDLCTAFVLSQWPGRNPFAQCQWEKYAWPSKKALIPQFADMLLRHAQLAAWTEELLTPISVWLSGLFNPMAYLTGVTQVTSRATGQPLDKMTQETHVTVYKDPDALPQPHEFPEAGAYVHGLFIEGARWPFGDEVEEVETIGGASVGGVLMESRLKELMPPMPVLYIKAVPVQGTWEPSAVGYLRHVAHIYECPVFITTMRGPTYIFLATLRTSEPKSKTREERERDFTRVCRAQLFLQFTQLDRGNATSLRLLDLERRETFDEYASQISERYFDAESFVLTEYAFALVSATTPFEFATQFNVAPNFSETRYVVVHDPERKALRILWAAFASDSPGAPPPQPPRRWPLFLCFISEPLLLRKNVGRFETRFTYCCERNHASSLGVAIDEWFRANATTLLRTP